MSSWFFVVLDVFVVQLAKSFLDSLILVFEMLEDDIEPNTDWNERDG